MTTGARGHSQLAADVPPLLAVLAAIDALRQAGVAVGPDAEALVVRLFQAEGRSLVRLARLFVDDRDAAEDLVQEAFLRLARHARSIEDPERAPAYLRSIVLNLARDHNRRGLVSLRHRAATGREVDLADDPADELADRLARDDRNVAVLAQVAALPRRQRDCVTLRYLEGLSPPEIAAALGLSTNSVKTHLRRGLEALRHSLGEVVGAGSAPP
ncbi:MAG: RNA polymerase sigma factor [Acidimicrobiia bacterium]|nr:RNA polymerase sigma factor [Acidimicrobiia bacterium]MDH4366481.1 RNA polymerase sigma factor [Acidimicrobiia bacterium]MDH5289920.1 RNA polymerase sigma factor [Acidimicrobiia bacterium]